MHFTIVKLPFSARSPPAQILCVDKIRFSAEKLLQDLGTGSRYGIEVRDRGIISPEMEISGRPGSAEASHPHLTAALAHTHPPSHTCTCRRG